MELVNGSGCQYACRPGTYNHSGHCIGKPFPVAPPGRSGLLSVPWAYRRPQSRLHKFKEQWALETAEPLSSELAVQLDLGSWMAWSQRRWTPHLNTSFGAEVSLHTHWLLLPGEVHYALRVRALVRGVLQTYAHGRWVRHGDSSSSSFNGSVEWSWGLGSGILGDSRALCSVKCHGGTLHHVHVANYTHTIFNTQRACANVSDGLIWLRNSTELYGVDLLLANYIRSECDRGTEAWVVPQAHRSLVWSPPIQVTCKKN